MRFPFLRSVFVLVSLTLLALAAPPPARAQTPSPIWIAVYGDNVIDDRINSGNPVTGERYGLNNYQAVLVSIADIEAGILQRTTDPFSAFIYTRPRGVAGPNLGTTASQRVRDFVGSPAAGMGNVVLLNGDFADALQAPTGGGGSLSDPNVERLLANSVIFAATPVAPGDPRGHGFIGEYVGAVAGLTSNAEQSPSRTALGFVSGRAGEIGFSRGSSDFAIFRTGAGTTHPVLAGLTLPYNPTPGTSDSVDYGAVITDVDPSLVIATYEDTDGNPAIIVRAGTPAPVPTAVIPEPGSLALLGAGVLPLAGLVRRHRRGA